MQHITFKPTGWLPDRRFLQALEYGIHALCLERVDGQLTIERVQSEHEVPLGDCMFDGIDDYHIRLTTMDVGVLLHELVHVMQYANYELEVYDEGHGYWQGKTLMGLTYEDSPWEIEAHHIEQILLRCFDATTEKSS